MLFKYLFFFIVGFCGGLWTALLITNLLDYTTIPTMLFVMPFLLILFVILTVLGVGAYTSRKYDKEHQKKE